MEKRRRKIFGQELHKSERKALMSVMACKPLLLYPTLSLLISALQGTNKYSDRTRINQILLFTKVSFNVNYNLYHCLKRL